MPQRLYFKCHLIRLTRRYAKLALNLWIRKFAAFFFSSRMDLKFPKGLSPSHDVMTLLADELILEQRHITANQAV